MSELETALAFVRQQAHDPAFHEFASSYMKSMRIYENHAPIYGNTTRIYDPMAEALRTLSEERPELFQQAASVVTNINVYVNLAGEEKKERNKELLCTLESAIAGLTFWKCKLS